jgi:hypothetical protein
MQQLTDLRRQTAATAQAPLGLTSWWERVWAEQMGVIAHEVADLSQNADVSLHQHIQDLDPGSPTFGKVNDLYLAGPGPPEFQLPEPFWSAPL